ncbi:MAG: endonuclease/exonuclease/phosphatase family protein [Patescibacteria group bacterium]
MRIITWNIHCATKNSPVWNILLELKPDIVLLQEVGSIPKVISDQYDICSGIAIYRTGKPQKFSTAVLVKGRIIEEIELRSKLEWVNKELEFFKGNFIAHEVKLPNLNRFYVISVYSPAWPVDESRLKDVDTSDVKLENSPKIWATEILWSALENTISEKEEWIVGGDYNSSETFDREYQIKHGLKGGIVSEGNKEIRDRMYELGFKECLREFNKRLVPTYMHTNKNVIHQLDHLYVTSSIFKKIKKCYAGDQSIIFGKLLSDHLPIIDDFTD